MNHFTAANKKGEVDIIYISEYFNPSSSLNDKVPSNSKKVVYKSDHIPIEFVYYPSIISE